MRHKLTIKPTMTAEEADEALLSIIKPILLSGQTITLVHVPNAEQNRDMLILQRRHPAHLPQEYKTLNVEDLVVEEVMDEVDRILNHTKETFDEK